MSDSGKIYNRCPAMIDAGIEDPDSKAGIEFCLACPYPKCVVFETTRSEQFRRNPKIPRSKELRLKGLSLRQIAAELGVDPRTVLRYLEKCKSG